MLLSPLSQPQPQRKPEGQAAGPLLTPARSRGGKQVVADGGLREVLLTTSAGAPHAASLGLLP